MPKALPTLNFSNTLKTWIIVGITILNGFLLVFFIIGLQYLCTRAHTAPRVKITNRKYNIHHTPYTNIQHTSTPQGSKTTTFNNGRYTTNFPQTPHSHYNRHKNKYAPYTSIVSRHLATRDNNKILHTPPPHICLFGGFVPYR